MYPYHDVMDFQRFTRDGLAELFREFEIIDLDVSVGAATAMIHQAQWTFAALLSFNNPRLFCAWKVLWGWVLFPLRYLNVLLEGNLFAKDCATAYRLVARKATSPKYASNIKKIWK
jgi:hypothetical protein